MDLSDTINSIMFKGRLGGCTGGGFKAQIAYVETDPSGRYGRFRDVLGKGAMKVVYRAFDELLGIEVAWNQVKLGDAFHSPEQLQRLYSEVHLLKHLSHDSMMIFYGSWIDVDCRTFNFITELFTSGTLREYRQKYNRVDIRAVKSWARQILSGLEYLHSNNPPVIHRDLKCDNIFVNGHLGQVKIGDLGLAAILRSSRTVAHSVIGTPEFMAPELYEEHYNELVDIYSFGMCMIEMLTFEFPYSECFNPAQIYKKVTSGKLPKAFYKIKDLEAQRFVGKCLAHVSKRPPAKELSLDPFLATELIELPIVVPVTLSKNQNLKLNSNAAAAATEVAIENLSMCDRTKSTDMTITGSINEEGNTVFLKVQICDANGKTRNVFFPFDTIKDTAIEVAMEMVRDLEITHLEPLEIAAMIDDEISAFVPTWRDKLITTNCKHQRQHSFNYEEDEDINNHHPFFVSSYSSPSSPHGSIAMSGSSYKNLLRGNHYSSFVPEWHQDDLISCMNDDSSSPSSMNSIKSSNVQYYCDSSNNEEAINKLLEASFCKKLICNPRIMHHTSCICGNNNDNSSSKLGLFPRLTRIRSFVDERRSQQLQRLLILEEAFESKRRMFNSVGAMENVGFKHPADRGGGGGCCSH